MKSLGLGGGNRQAAGRRAGGCNLEFAGWHKRAVQPQTAPNPLLPLPVCSLLPTYASLVKHIRHPNPLNAHTPSHASFQSNTRVVSTHPVAPPDPVLAPGGSAGVPGEQFADVDKALDERTIGHNPERLSLMKV